LKARHAVRAAYIYVLASKVGGTIYVGAATNLVARVYQHRTGAVEGFTKKYNVKRLVYYESYDNLEAALLRERQMKTWNRSWKIQLIEKDNPHWRDLDPEIACL
jgi:putative endonuclease